MDKSVCVFVIVRWLVDCFVRWFWLCFIILFTSSIHNKFYFRFASLSRFYLSVIDCVNRSVSLFSLSGFVCVLVVCALVKPLRLNGMECLNRSHSQCVSSRKSFVFYVFIVWWKIDGIGITQHSQYHKPVSGSYCFSQCYCLVAVATVVTVAPVSLL